MTRENGLGVRVSLTALIKIGRYANWRSRRSVKPLPSGVVGSNPALPIYMPQSLSWWRSCLEDSRPVIPACRFKSCLRRYHIWRRVLTGRQPVPNTGDPKGFGGSNPPVFAYKPLWQNWQMHLPAKQGSVDPASGVGTRERRSVRGAASFPSFFLKTCNKALKLYYEYNDKAFKRCYSGCQKK